MNKMFHGVAESSKAHSAASVPNGIFTVPNSTVDVMHSKSLERYHEILARHYPVLSETDIRAIAGSLPDALPNHPAKELHTGIAGVLESWGLQFSAGILLGLAGRGSKGVAVEVVRQFSESRFKRARMLMYSSSASGQPIDLQNVGRVSRGNLSRDSSVSGSTGNMQKVSSEHPMHGTSEALDHSTLGINNPDPRKTAVDEPVNSLKAKGSPENPVPLPRDPGLISAPHDSTVANTGSSVPVSPGNSASSATAVFWDQKFQEMMTEAIRRVIEESWAQNSKDVLAHENLVNRLQESMTRIEKGIENIGGTLNWLKTTIDTERQLRRHLQERGPLQGTRTDRPDHAVSPVPTRDFMLGLSPLHSGRDGGGMRKDNPHDVPDPCDGASE